MLRSRSAIVRFSLIILVTLTLSASVGSVALSAGRGSWHTRTVTSRSQSGRRTPPPAPERRGTGVQVTLSAAHETLSWDDRDPERGKFQLSLLYLHRQREPADVADRTLQIDIAGVPAGSELVIEMLSIHVDRSSGERRSVTERLTVPDRPCTMDDPCTARLILDPSQDLSDFYTLRLKNDAGALLWSSLHPQRPDFVVLDTWDAAMGDHTIRVIYATLFPFARGERDVENRLQPGAVTDFIAYVFVPMIQETWHTQLEAWGFGDPIHPEWDGDHVVEIIVTPPHLALFDGTGPYTIFVDARRNPYPERRIWWPSSSNNYWAYDLLPNGYKMMFAHEFFHLAQWNVLLSTGQPVNFWQNVFIEAQAGFAPSAQYPEIEIEERHVIRDVSEGRVANRFLSGRLNSSYAALELERVYKYDAGLYWRFLYEAHHDMRVLRLALEEMTRHPDLDIVTALDAVMDRALARVDGPFPDFEASLAAFARANYGLRLENGRCESTELSECGGFYFDPKDVYVDPPAEAELAYDGSPLTYSGNVPASYGMDFIEVGLEPGTHDQPLTITFRGEGEEARFSVQLWRLGPGLAKPRALTPAPEVVLRNEEGAYVYRIEPDEDVTYYRLALIITRLDPDEAKDPAGNYSIILNSSPPGSSNPATG